MKKIITLILAMLCVFISYSQWDNIQRDKLMADSAMIANLHFIWRSDTIDFTDLMSGEIISKGDSTIIFVTPTQMAAYVAATAGHDQVTLNQSAIDGGVSLTGQEISFQQVSEMVNGYLNYGDYSSFLLKMDSVFTDETIVGKGTQADPLGVDQALIENSLQTVFTLELPQSQSVGGRVSGATLPDGWTIAAGTNTADLKVTHNLNRGIANVSVWSIDGTSRRPLGGNAAFSGLYAPDKNELLIEGFATIQTALTVQLIFAPN